MVPLLYIFPIIFLVMAIIAFFIDLDEPKGKMIFIGLASVLIIMLIGNETTVHMQVSHSNKLQDKVDQVIDWKTGQIARMNTILASLSTQTLSERDKLAGLANLGWASSNPLLQEAFTADEARIELLEYMPQARNHAVIQNLPNTVDKMLVSFTLEEMGFIVSAQQTQEEYKKKDEQKNDESKEDEDKDKDKADDEAEEDEEDEPKALKNKGKKKKKKKKKKETKKKNNEVNALFFGHLVRNNDIKLVLYTMLRAGIQIRSAKVFRKKSNENARHIKFGYSKSYEKRAPFSVEKIKKTKVFKR